MSEISGRLTLTMPIVTRIKAAGGAEREETLAEVTVRRPLTGDLRVMDGVQGEVAQGIALAARLTGLDQRTIDKMDLVDFAALSGLIEGFMPAGLRTGATSSGQ